MICKAFRKNITSVHGANSLFKNPFHIEKNSSLFTGTALGGIHILHNRKNNFNYFFISICIACIPLSILLLIQRYNCRSQSRQCLLTKPNRTPTWDTNVYLLSALPAGEALTKDDSTSCTVNFHAVNRFSMLLTAKIDRSICENGTEKGQLLTADFSIRMKDFTERNRYLELSDIRLPESVHTNNLIDIRISFLPAKIILF